MITQAVRLLPFRVELPLVTAAGLLASVVAAGAAETVLFADSFNRPDAATPGPAWMEYAVRKSENSVPRQSDTNWCIKDGSLFFTATGGDSYIEDFVQTTETFPVDNLRMEFDLRGTAATRKGYVGPACFLAPPASVRKDAMNITTPAQGYILGVEAFYRWENQGTRGLVVLANGGQRDFASAVFGGLNQGEFVHHVIVVKDNAITYSSPVFPAVTIPLQNPLEPNARRHLSFGARLYDAGVPQTIEIRNLKLTRLSPDAPRRPPSFQLKVEPSAGPLPKPESFYNDIAVAFLRAAAAGELFKLKPLVTDAFSQQHSLADLAEFGEQLAALGGREPLAQQSRPASGGTVETLIVLRNAQGRKITAQLILIDGRVDRCVVKKGVQ